MKLLSAIGLVMALGLVAGCGSTAGPSQTQAPVKVTAPVKPVQPMDNIPATQPQAVNCVVALPKGYDRSQKYPAIIALYGAMSNPQRHAQYFQPIADKYGYLVFCPALPNIMNPMEVARQSQTILDAALSRMKDCNVDFGRVYLSSVSFSTVALFRIAGSDPKRFKGVIVSAPSKSPDPDDLAKEGMSNLPVYIWQGSNDRLKASGQNINRMLTELKFDRVRYKDAQGFGHQSPPLEEWAEILDWLDSGE